MSMHRFAASILAAAAIALAPLAGGPAEAGIDPAKVEFAPNAETFTLDNGLEVVVIPDQRAPVVTHMLWYKAGSADEPPGKSGIAHYLEHLMFKGTERYPDSYFSDRIAAVGGQENAFTSSDYTGYFQQVAKEHLAEMMALEADRMRNLEIDDAQIAAELKVVMEERRVRVENDPSGELGESVDAALFVNHPYGNPIIGWPAEIEALSAVDAIAFYQRFYAPQNAVLVVAGDVAADEVRQLAEATYGRIPRDDGAETRKRPQVPELRTRFTVELEDERVNQESLQQLWRVPSYTTAAGNDGEALEVLAEILGGGATSRLYGAMVRGDGPASAAGAWYQSTALDDTKFGVYAVPKDGVTLIELEPLIRAEIDRIVEAGVTDEELARAKTSLVASAVYAQDSQDRLARIFGSALVTGSTVADVKAWPREIAAVTSADVERAAATYLKPTTGVTGRLLRPADAPKT